MFTMCIQMGSLTCPLSQIPAKLCQQIVTYCRQPNILIHLTLTSVHLHSPRKYMIHYILLKNFSWLIAIIVCDNVICCILGFNSSPPGAAYMRQRTGSSLVQVMSCRLFGAKPLPEPMMAYCQPDSWEQISVKFKSEFCHFHSRKCIWKYRLPNWRPFFQGEMN